MEATEGAAVAIEEPTDAASRAIGDLNWAVGPRGLAFVSSDGGKEITWAEPTLPLILRGLWLLLA